MVDHLHAKTMGTAPRDTLADAPHAQNAQCGAMDVGTSKQVVAPFGPQTSTQVMLAFGDASCGRHQQRKTKVGGGFGQHIRRVSGENAGRCHGCQVKIVVANRHVGADFECRTGGQNLLVNRISPSRENALHASQTLSQHGLGPNFVRLVGIDLKMLRQACDNLRENRTRNQDSGLGLHGSMCQVELHDVAKRPGKIAQQGVQTDFFHVPNEVNFF